MKQLLILGAGTGGTLAANLLARKLNPKEWQLTVIDRAAEHVYQPGLIFLPFKLYGYKTRDDLVKPIGGPLPRAAKFVAAGVTAIKPEQSTVETGNGSFRYDWLICALGCRLAPEEIPGLAEAMAAGNAHTFYSLEGALALQPALEKFDRGHLVLNIAEMPIKCPVAPIEFAFLADSYFRKRGVREAIRISLVTPYAGAFTKPNANRVLTALAKEKGIEVVPDFALEKVDGDRRRIQAYGGKELEYDLFIVIPPTLGPEALADSGLAGDTDYGLTHPRTLKSERAANIYFLGDNANLATSKAGSVTHFESETVVENLLREIEGKPPHSSYDGHANCFIETGDDKAMLIDFNYDMEPLPGEFPLPVFGPFSLLKETHLNHLGKLAFKFVYWHLLLPGRLPQVPLLPAHMSFLGKDAHATPVARQAEALTVADIMQKKVISITRGSPLTEAARLLREHHISGLPVLEVDGRIAGILTEGDFLAALDLSKRAAAEKALHTLLHNRRGKKPIGTIVDDLMTPKPVTVSADTSLPEAVSLMDRQRVKRLPVVDDQQRVVGILARADLLRLFVS